MRRAGSAMGILEEGPRRGRRGAGPLIREIRYLGAFARNFTPARVRAREPRGKTGPEILPCRKATGEGGHAKHGGGGTPKRQRPAAPSGAPGRAPSTATELGCCRVRLHKRPSRASPTWVAVPLARFAGEDRRGGPPLILPRFALRRVKDFRAFDIPKC